MPLASIVVPAFNAAATLPDTLRSLQGQTCRDLEVVVVDDGSTDETAAIVAHAADADPRIRLVKQPNRGLAGARNSGIAQATGAYIGFCDADDLWHPAKLQTHIAHFATAPAVGLSFSGSLLIDAQGRATGHAQRPRLAGITPRHVFKRNPVGNGSAPVFRRAALDAIAWRPRIEFQRDWIFDETFRQSEDIECWLRFALCTDWRIEGVPGLLTCYRIHRDALSADTDRQMQSWERMVVKLRPLAPAFFATHTDAARAYQLRYLARRSVRNGDAAAACRLAAQALAASRAPLVEEPLKTLTTWLAARALQRFGRAPLDWAAALRRLAARHMPERTP
ncbi:glycosyltransferase family 2 protein [Actibacterium ureilyticum]|uniref:glycosyltransferase family 2 protein n=1 Tax=Actibacterium ureilyticum TaxID=1590614 RepID=UPI000BAB0374|nr:glycosyltransferase family 2 protein [Actibacterium ureilyticum]